MPLQGTIGLIMETQRDRRGNLLLEWQINQFFNLSDGVDDWYESTPFGFNDGCWVLGVFPNGQRQPGPVILFVKKIDTGLPKNVHLTLAVKGSGGVEMKVESQWEFSSGGDPWFWCQICSRSELWEHQCRFTPDDVLTITCDLEIDVSTPTSGVSLFQDSFVQTGEEFSGPYSDSFLDDLPLDKKDASIQTDMDTKDEEQSANQGFEDWQESLLKLLESGKDSDVIIKVKDKQFPAHRILLQARSAVFEAMFDPGMEQQQNAVVTMEDCDPETFPDFLKHIYTGSTDMISARNVFSLYYASDKYDLKNLKEHCVDFIKRNLSVASFCEAIALAVKYDEKELAELARAFFCANTLDIVETVEWQTFLAANPAVGNELFILSYKKSKYCSQLLVDHIRNGMQFYSHQSGSQIRRKRIYGAGERVFLGQHAGHCGDSIEANVFGSKSDGWK